MYLGPRKQINPQPLGKSLETRIHHFCWISLSLIPIRYSNPSSPMASMVVPEELMPAIVAKPFMASMQGGAAMHVTFQNLLRKPVTVSVPLKGFTIAYDKMN